MAGDLVGSSLGPYLIEELIGRGGMGEVYLATHSRLERRVALKVLPPDMSHDESFRARFLRESQLAARLDHPNVVPVYDADEADGRLYIVMRYVRGTDLSNLLANESPLEVQRGLLILRQVASALDAAHAIGLVHRDVKPANVLVAEDGHCFLTDFGLTRLAGGGASTEYGTLVGTLEYVSPEQINGAELDARSDVYSFGCLAFEVLTGVRPFVRNNAAALLNDHLNTPPPKATVYRPELGKAVDEVLGYAMAKRPDKRYASAGEFADALEQAAPQPVVAPAQPDAPEAGTGAPKKWMLAAFGTGGMILLAALIFIAVRQPKQTAPTRPAPTLSSDVPAPNRGIIAVGEGFSCAVTASSEVACWGTSRHAVLGRTEKEPQPGLVHDLSNVSKIVAGEKHACALKRDGSVWCWGDNELGQLSRPTATDNVASPVQIDTIPQARDLVSGQGHSCAIARTGTLHCWGWDHYGQSSGAKDAARVLDGRDVDQRGVRRAIYTFRAGPAIPGLTGVLEVAAGYEFTCALSADGVRCWGLNIYGRVLARDPKRPVGTFPQPSTRVVFTPTIVAGLESGIRIAGSHGHTCLARAADVACWGGDTTSPDGADGRLGTPGRPAFGTIPIGGVDRLLVGEQVNCAIRVNELLCWGRANNSLLRPGRPDGSVFKMGAGAVVDASIGADHACVVLMGGEVMCWGSNAQRQLGTGGSPTSFVRVPGVTARTPAAPSPSPTAS